MSPDPADRPGDRDRPSRWPPSFPHPQIEALLARVQQARSVDPDEAELLLRMVAREVHRLRFTSTQLSMSRLHEAEREADDILWRAHLQAEELRSAARRAIDGRLEEAEALLAAMRRPSMDPEDEP